MAPWFDIGEADSRDSGPSRRPGQTGCPVRNRHLCRKVESTDLSVTSFRRKKNGSHHDGGSEEDHRREVPGRPGGCSGPFETILSTMHNTARRRGECRRGPETTETFPRKGVSTSLSHPLHTVPTGYRAREASKMRDQQRSVLRWRVGVWTGLHRSSSLSELS